MKKTFTGTLEQIKLFLWEFKKDKLYDIEIKLHRNKRSLDANSYMWVLVTKIANTLRKSKEEIYLQMLKDYGQAMLVPIKAGDNPNGYFKYFDYECSRLINGKKADYYKVYKGSSEYDTYEMSVLIDGVVQEAKGLEIETLPPHELEFLKNEWR